jgi:type IV secretory pathway TrbF-like protein
MTAQNMAGDVDDIIRKNAGDPSVLTITVDITSFNPIPNSSSYQIEWAENKRMADGTTVPAYYRANISVSTFTPSDPNVYYLNPLGILVTRFDIFKIKPGV